MFTLVSRHRKWVQHDVEHTPFILASIRRTNNLTGGTQNSTVFFLFFFFSSFLPWSIKHSIFGQWNLEPFLQTFGKLYLFCKSCPNAHMSSELERPGESNQTICFHMLSAQYVAQVERLNSLTPPRIDPGSKKRGDPFYFNNVMGPDFIQYHFSLEFSSSLPKTSNRKHYRTFHSVSIVQRVAILF